MSADVQGILWGIGLFVAVAIPSAWMFWKDMTYQKNWVLLSNTKFFYLKTQGVDPIHLAQATDLAIKILAAHSIWTEAQIHDVLTGWRLSIRETPAFYDALRRKVAGVSYNFGVIEVGSDLKALCHEFAHVVSGRLTGNWLLKHEGWVESGFSAAEIEYVAKVAFL